MAEGESISSLVDCNDSRFLAPENMTQEIKKYCIGDKSEGSRNNIRNLKRYI